MDELADVGEFAVHDYKRISNYQFLMYSKIVETDLFNDVPHI